MNQNPYLPPGVTDRDIDAQVLDSDECTHDETEKGNCVACGAVIE